MTSVGALKYGVKIEGGDDAIATLQTMNDSFEEMGQSAELAAEELEASEDAAGSFDSSAQEAETSAGFFGLKMGGLTYAAVKAKSALVAVGGALTGTAGLVAALLIAGTALGLVVGELTGMTDLTPLAAREFGLLGQTIIDVASAGLWPFIAAWGVLESFLENGVSGILPAIMNSFTELGKILGRIGTHAAAAVSHAGNLVFTGLSAVYQTFVWLVKKGVNSGIDAINYLISKYNAAVDKLPSDVVSNAISIGEFGRLENDSFGDRMDAVGQAGRDRMDHIIQTHKEQTDDLGADPINPSDREKQANDNHDPVNPDARTASSGSGDTPQQQTAGGEQKIEIKVENNGYGEMDRRAARELADRVAKELDININHIR